MGDDNFSQDVRAGIVEAAKKYGMQIVIDDKLPDAFTDMSATLTKVKALKPDALLISGHEKGALTAARQIAEQKIDVPLLAMTHCDSADIIGQVGAGRRIHAVRLAMGALADLQGQVVRHGGGIQQGLHGEVRP